MKRQDNQQQLVKDFFDNVASSYQQKYHPQHSFLHYFFQQRLSEATASFSFEKKSILDIGAGPAPLYFFLKKETNNFQYFATDIAPKMRAQSGLSAEQYFIGTLNDFPFPEKKYDFIFLLGVTTYLAPKELDTNLQFIQKHLSSTGIAIVSFTNKNSFDFRIRQVIRFLTRILNLKSNVMGQQFNIYAFSISQIHYKFSSIFQIEKTSYLNQTIPPFNRIFPKSSISIANFLKKNITSNTLLSWLSSDFMVFIKNRN